MISTATKFNSGETIWVLKDKDGNKIEKILDKIFQVASDEEDNLLYNTDNHGLLKEEYIEKYTPEEEKSEGKKE